jgi:hypothetical protein
MQSNANDNNIDMLVDDDNDDDKMTQTQNKVFRITKESHEMLLTLDGET